LFALACAPAPNDEGGSASATSNSGTDGGFNPNTGSGDGDDGTSGSDNVDDGQGVGDDTGFGEPIDVPVYDGIVGYPSPELYLQIVGPSAKRHVATGGSITYIAGLLFGNAKKIVWQSTTGQSGQASGGRFWKTGPITLVPGDNIIMVKAVNDSRESEDKITVTYNPGFFFAEQPQVRPKAFFAGSKTNVVVNVPVRTKNIVPSSVTLWEVDKEGNTLYKVGQMVDNGDTFGTSCDEIQDDSVFSRCVEMESNTAQTRYLRMSLQINMDGTNLTVYSPVTEIEIIEPVATAECNALHQVLKDAKQLHTAESQGGNPDASAAVVSMLKNSPRVADAGRSAGGYGVWAEFKNGVLGALNLSPKGQRGGAEPNYGTQQGALVGNPVYIESKKVLAMAPFNQEFGALDEVPQIAAQLNSQICPEFQVDGPHLNGQAGLDKLRKAYEYGILMISTHSDTYFESLDSGVKEAFYWEHDGSQEILWTGDKVSCAQLHTETKTCSQDSDCKGNAECVITNASGSYTSGVCLDHTQVDLRRGRIIMGADTWGVHPRFFPHHAKRQWPSTLVYLGACRSLYNGTLAGELFGAGAKTVAGFTNYVSSQFVSKQAKNWFGEMLKEERSTGQAALFPITDPKHPTGMFQLFGGSNVIITDAQILNAGFERGDTTGWNVDGDGRVISQLGISVPVGGKFMGILSTGLGYTQQTGELSQSFCVPAGTQEVSFYWKYFSEEFKEWCGSSFQDTFQATLEAKGGKITLVDVTVDDLCPASECVGCGNKFVGLVASDVSFDQGGVYNIQWQKLVKNVPALKEGGPVMLRLFATDQGDSIYDTVILVDSIVFD
jgi:hypothetical protein